MTAKADRPLRVLGIETSCDETGAAVVDGDRNILAERLLSQLAEHAPYGGVVPEIAARAHLQYLDGLVARAMAASGTDWDGIDGVAATGGPGLIGGVMVGVMTAKAIALARGLPFLAINHLEGHALSARLTEDVEFPWLLLLMSGGHCQILVVSGVGRYQRLGTTLDDAIGEAFDKTAKLLGLGWPGGPAVERAARTGDPERFRLPRPMAGREGCDFSFAGLKTAVARTVAGLPGGPQGDKSVAGLPGGPPGPTEIADLCAGFQAAVADVLADRTGNAAAMFREIAPHGRDLVVAGGVAANAMLRDRLAAVAAKAGLRLVAPPPAYCTDNAAIIAWAGIERLRLGLTDPLDFAPRPRWPLEAVSGAAAAPA